MSGLIESETRAPGLPRPTGAQMAEQIIADINAHTAACAAERDVAIQKALRMYAFMRGDMPEGDFKYLVTMVFLDGLRLGVDQQYRRVRP